MPELWPLKVPSTLEMIRHPSTFAITYGVLQARCPWGYLLCLVPCALIPEVRFLPGSPSSPCGSGRCGPQLLGCCSAVGWYGVHTAVLDVHVVCARNRDRPQADAMELASSGVPKTRKEEAMSGFPLLLPRAVSCTAQKCSYFQISSTSHAHSHLHMSCNSLQLLTPGPWTEPCYSLQLYGVYQCSSKLSKNDSIIVSSATHVNEIQVKSRHFSSSPNLQTHSDNEDTLFSDLPPTSHDSRGSPPS